MTRIGLAVHGQPPELVGGTESLVAELAAELRRAGDEVEVFSGSIVWKPEFEVVRDESGEVPVTRVHRHDLFFERWDKVSDPFVERAWLAWLDAFRPELVHVHHWARLTTGLVASASARGVPCVVSLHDLFPSCPRYHRVKDDLSFCEVPASPDACRHCVPRWTFQSDAEIDASVRAFTSEMRAELEAAAALVAPTEGHARRILAWLGSERSVTAVPPAGRSLRAPATRPLGDAVASAERPLRVGVFGHLHPLKGVGVLLDALATTPAPSPWTLDVWGAAPDEATDADLRARAHGLPVTFHGAYVPDDLAGAALDAVALPTLCAESYSFALDEAAALSVPIVATDLGALADRATERMALVPRGDAQAFRDALLRLGRDPSERARRRAAPAPTTLAAAETLARLRDVYAAVLAAPRPAVRPIDERQLADRCRLFELREAGLHELMRRG